MRLIFTLLSLVGALLSLSIIAGVVIALLVLFGEPGIDECTRANGETFKPVNDLRFSDSFQGKWTLFTAALDQGMAGEVTFSSDEATSRANAFMQERTDVIKDIVVCFEPGKALASATFADILGRDIEARMEGSLDLSGDHPKLKISRMRVGSLPLLGPTRRTVSKLVNDQLDDLTVDHRFKLSFEYDAAKVEGQP